MNKEMKYCVVGGGLVGSLLSVILAKRGYNVDVWERRPDMRKAEIQGGRSINLALSDRGFKALQIVGLEDEVRKLCIPMHGRVVHDVAGNTNFMPYGKPGQFINSVSRGGLNQLMINKANESPNVHLHFDEKCENIDFAKGAATFKNTVTDELSHGQYDLIFGTDGAFSAARSSLMKTDRFDFTYRQDYLEHGYKELSIPPTEDGGWRIEKNALHIWPRKSFMMIALPNLDGSFTVTLFLPLEGEISFSNLNTEQEIKDFFLKYFPSAVPLMPHLIEDFHNNPASTLATIRCSPWHYKDKGLLLGDAAHAIVPFYGQGMNCGFEDCTVLNELIEENDKDWAKILPQFSNLRKPNGDAVADLALMNFIEMRDLVADPHFILKNKIDKKIGEFFPDKWLPLYSMVTFSDMPYADAIRIGKEHSTVLEQIVKENPDIEQLLNTPELKDKLKPYAN